MSYRWARFAVSKAKSVRFASYINTIFLRMFDITGDHITQLNDEDLRTLVTKLCEAELRRANLPLAAVTSGGDQNAADGGIDVRVELLNCSTVLDFIPKGITGFQVKKPDMPASAITEEMRPDGVLRPSITQLGLKHGAYVIISAQGSTADSALANRKSAMQSAINDLPSEASLFLDFYDRDRLARWVRNYPGVALWLRGRIGEPLAGWRTYGNWAYGDPVDSEYLLDDKCRIVAPQPGNLAPLTIAQGIQAMRSILESSGGIIRLIGLSGTGKTRLAQALFDSKIGEGALDRSIVVYVDQGSEQPPTPSARDMIHRLAADGLRAILVVDNCNPTTHRDLAQAVGTSGGSLSLITVEYDVSDDEPEETHVFRLEPASEKIIEEILERLTPNLSQADRHLVAEFSSGNARIALALARTVTPNENLGTLKDSELFKRLFHQRKDSGEGLMRAAEVCSLVYSFDGETLEGVTAELSVLAELAGISTNELYRHVNELHSRDLVQRRSRWRAVLPHAIANRLARQTLESIHSETLISAVSRAGRERLLKSFSRRLSYLHDCEQAKQIAGNWLSPPEGESNPAQLNALGISIFKNLAPLQPGLALQAIESATLGENGKVFLSTETSSRWEWCGLLRALAYEPQYFSRATLLLAKYMAEEPANYNYNSAKNHFTELFHLYLSGTHALVSERLGVVQQLLASENSAFNAAGLEALNAMMEVMHFTLSHDVSFGARSRDFGWEPKAGEYSAWFREVISFVKGTAAAEPRYTLNIKTMLARHFRGLWTRAGICTDLEELARYFFAQDGWADGWLAIRQTISFDLNSMSPEFAERTRALELELRPQGLEWKIRAYVLSGNHNYFDLIDTELGVDDSNAAYERASERINKIVEGLAVEALLAPDILQPLLPDLLRSHGQMKWQFGRGLANGTQDIQQTWQQLCTVLSTLSEKDRDVSLLRGFIEAVSVRDPVKANQLLDAAVTDPILCSHFPILQASIEIDEAGASRLISSILSGRVQSWVFKYLCMGRVSDAIPLASLRRILLGITSLPDGYQVVVDIFGMRLHSLKGNKAEINQGTAALGRELLILNDFRDGNQNHAYRVNEIAIVCLQGKVAYDDALRIARNLAHALVDYRSKARQYSKLAETLFRLQPAAAIKGLLENESDSGVSVFNALWTAIKEKLLRRRQDNRSRRSLTYSFNFDRESPVNAADQNILIAWAKENPKVRLPILAEEVHLFVRNGERDTLVWSPLALDILEMATDRPAILEIFASRFSPKAWSGSLADVLMPYLGLAEKLQTHSDPQVVAWAKKQSVFLSKRIEAERKSDRQVDESFE